MVHVRDTGRLSNLYSADDVDVDVPLIEHDKLQRKFLMSALFFLVFFNNRFVSLVRLIS
jgi:hypothetical protein